ncbi:FAD-dependent monooxygenase [Nocardia altamirensis]|uniref:FAD-dependent monooxygenase n=1 Tax=Nocardia altamirensis TaxID=472158 RepID=UPI0008402F6D|nr:FAD-dependent monooxygenase [Nocardia altamirensis]
MRNQSVLISGASVAGPALAYWLDRYGFDVTVVERAPALRQGGQAIDFKGHTQFTVLERMGILDDVNERRTGTTDTIYVDDNGKQLAVMSGDFTGGDLEILRGDLAEIMYERTAERCEYLFGDSISALTELSDGVYVEFEHGQARSFDLVFGADGIHSRVRKLAFGPEADLVKFLGYYYCVAGASPWGTEAAGPRERVIAYGHSAPGKMAISGGPKAQQFYVFASPELDYSRDDTDAQKRIVERVFADTNWEVPRMLDEMADFDDFYLDSLSQVQLKGVYTKGRVALIGDSAWGNTLGGFGTGLAVVGAYVIAGELALAGGDYAVAFARYNEIMKAHAKVADNGNAGKFLAPRTARGIKMRNWFLNSRLFTLMFKYIDKVTNDIDLQDYPTMVGAREDH